MKFVDSAIITVIAGNGGDGCISFRREKFIPKGGPDGGNGGNGGNIFIQTNENINTLIDFRVKKIFTAKNGKKGLGNNKSGKNGKDLKIYVPLGTRILDTKKNIIIDLYKKKQKIKIAQGGKKGFGNSHFKSSINRSPQKKTEGKKGEKKNIILELIILANVGTLGLPNSGKSTLIASVTNAKTKINSYPFTTLYPIIGKINNNSNIFLTIADLPGLIKNASSGIGLGIKFLKHLERCTLLLHIIDVSILNVKKIKKNIFIILQEIKKFNKNLYNKKIWIIFNKIDLIPFQYREKFIKKIKNKIIQKDKKCYFISAKNKIGTKKLSNKIISYFEKNNVFKK